MRSFVLATLFVCLCATAVFGDEVTLKNGDHLTGTIVKSDDKMEAILLKTEFAGDVNVKWSAITAITSSQPLHLVLTDGTIVVGTVTTVENDLKVATKTEGEVKAPKNTVKSLKNDDEEHAYETAEYRKEHPHIADIWSGLLDTGLSVTSGNSSTVNYTLAAKAARVTPKDKISMYSTVVYGRNNAVDPSQTIAHEVRGGIRADINVSKKMFVFGFTDFGYNALQHLDLQNVAGGGAGYHAINTARMKFDLLAGASYNQEYFGSYTIDTPLPPTSFPSASTKNTELVFGESLDSKLTSRTTLSENFSFYPGVDSIGGYRFTYNSNIVTKLKNWLGWQITFNDNYISNPPTGLKGNDLLFSTGLRLTFGKGVF
jgi:putative salt-induced outer membrane protein YdiY